MRNQRLVIPAEVELLEEGGYLAICPIIHGCHAEGDTLGEALENLQDVARVLLECMVEDGLPWPSELRELSDQPLREELIVTLTP